MSEESTKPKPRLVRINRKGASAYGAMHLEGREAEVLYAGYTLVKVRFRREPGATRSIHEGRNRIMFFNHDEIEEMEQIT